MASSESSYRKLLLEAKAQQHSRLGDASAASEQLSAAIAALTRANSRISSGRSSAVIEKISTIHELDKEIDRQLHEDIAPNYIRAVKDTEKLAAYVRKSHRSLAMDHDTQTSYVDVLQRRLELADQDIRILEHTLELVKNWK